MMDKPAGPRQQPPDKRHVAYESIFGARTGAPSPHDFPPNAYPSYPQNQPFQYQQQVPYNGPERRTTYPVSYPGHQPYPNPNGHPPPPMQPPPGPQGAYSQGYYAPPNQHNVPNQYTPYQYPPQLVQSPYNYPASLGPPTQSLSRARSVIGNNATLSPPMDMVPSSSSHPALPLTGNYQTQPYVDGSRRQPSPQPPVQHPPADWTQHRASPGAAPRRPSQSHKHNSNGSSRSTEPPRLGISLEHDEGRLGIDFGENASGSNSDPSTDEGDSELPYARSETSSTSQFHRPPRSSGDF